jgi:hypothetical protein
MWHLKDVYSRAFENLIEKIKRSYGNLQSREKVKKHSSLSEKIIS